MTGPRRGALGPRWCVDVGLRLAGARALQLRPGDDVPFDELDGFVITGGHDVQPALYQAPSEVQGNYDGERDRFESAVIDQALATGKPLLGICRGAQLLNVRRGGTLVQDLTDRREHTSNRRSLLPLKNVDLERTSLLAELAGAKRLRVNSLHRQAIDRVGAALAVTARDRDGIVQAVEDPEGALVLGVQWHPEFLLYLGSQRRIFRALVAAAEAERS